MTHIKTASSSVLLSFYEFNILPNTLLRQLNFNLLYLLVLLRFDDIAKLLRAKTSPICNYYSDDFNLFGK